MYSVVYKGFGVMVNKLSDEDYSKLAKTILDIYTDLGEPWVTDYAEDFDENGLVKNRDIVDELFDAEPYVEIPYNGGGGDLDMLLGVELGSWAAWEIADATAHVHDVEEAKQAFERTVPEKVKQTLADLGIEPHIVWYHGTN